MNVKKLDIVIFGAGGHAKVVADILIQTKRYQIMAFIDDYKESQKIWNIPVISEKSYFAQPLTKMGIIALGDNHIREKVVKNTLSRLPEFVFITAIHPSAQIATDTHIGIGSVVMANAVINPSTKIGQHCIINTAASVDHDCLIDDFVSLAPHVCLGGNCHVGFSSAISIGATLLHRITVGSHTVVGAGSLVTKDISENCVSYGTPAKIIRSRKSGDKYL